MSIFPLRAGLPGGVSGFRPPAPVAEMELVDWLQYLWWSRTILAGQGMWNHLRRLSCRHAHTAWQPRDINSADSLHSAWDM